MSHPLSRPYHCAAYKGESIGAIERAMLLPDPSLSQISLAQCGAIGAISRKPDLSSCFLAGKSRTVPPGCPESGDTGMTGTDLAGGEVKL